MDKEQIRKEILVRIEIEQQVREQLRDIKDQGVPPKKSHWAWLDSKMALLVIGAVISGVLVPTFQFTQQKFNWHRQNRYDSLDRQLGNMRESLKQFIAVQGLSAELFDLGLEIIDIDSAVLLQARLNEWHKMFRSIRARRVQQNAAFAATVFYFPTRSRETIREAWNNLLLPAQKLDTLVDDLLSISAQGSDGKIPQKLTSNETAVQLDVNFSEANQAYKLVLAMLRQQLQEVEHESTKFQ